MAEEGAEIRVPELEAVSNPAPPAKGGRPPRSWCGARIVLEELWKLKPGLWLKITPPKGVPKNRIRWGIYRTAKNRGAKVKIQVGLDGLVYVRRA
ncbi:MAG: hypothetical protein L0170_18355 [Acidobacteria bacterium]|nr:hypothetical protein [Acidobacteriota bacterium]